MKKGENLVTSILAVVFLLALVVSFTVNTDDLTGYATFEGTQGPPQGLNSHLYESEAGELVRTAGLWGVLIIFIMVLTLFVIVWVLYAVLVNDGHLV